MASGFLSGLFGEEDEEEVTPSSPKIEDPKVREYLTGLYGDKFSDAAREKLVAQNQKDSSGPNWMAGLAALGTGLQGGNAASAGQEYLKNQQAMRDKKVSDFDASRKSLVEGAKIGRDLRDDMDLQEKMARERDATSEESKIAQQVAIEMGMNPQTASRLTAEQWKAQGPYYQKLFDIRESSANRRDARDARQAELDLKREDKRLLADEKKKATTNEVEQRRTDIKQNLALVKDQIKQSGTWEMFGSHNQDIERRLDSVATDMAKLMDPTSVARPAEVDAIKRNLVKSGFTNSNDTALQILENFEKEVDSRANNAYRIRGLDAPGSEYAASGGDSAAKSRQARIAELKAKKAGRYAAQ